MGLAAEILAQIRMVSAASTASARNSLGWQLQKLTQWGQERLERWLSGWNPTPVDQTVTAPGWLLEALFWLLAIGATGWLSWQLYQVLQPYLPQLRWQSRPAPEPQLTPSNWLSEAEAAQAQAQYKAACRALYMAALQKLSEQNLIAPQLSRTDGEYLALLRSLALPSPYQVLIQTHERLYFDQLVASAELCNQCWQAYRQIELIAPAAPITSGRAA